MIHFLRKVCLPRHGKPGAPIFILGTGRSGTHWLAKMLAKHPELYGVIEGQPGFGWSTAMAIDPGLEPELFPRLIAFYRAGMDRARPFRFLDKSHPNLWLAEKLAAAFPDAQFLGIQRAVLPTVASMLLHPEVLSWQRRWREFPVPNRFLGIEPGFDLEYGQMPEPERCALRWLAHRNELRRLAGVLGGRLHCLDYEQLMDTPEVVMKGVEDFLGLDAPVAVIPARAESANKWRQQFSELQAARIHELVSRSA